MKKPPVAGVTWVLVLLTAPPAVTMFSTWAVLRAKQMLLTASDAVRSQSTMRVEGTAAALARLTVVLTRP